MQNLVQDARSRHPARHFDGLSADSRPAEAWVDAAGVWVAREGVEPRCWLFTELVLMRGGGREPVQLERRSTPVEVLLVEAPEFFGEIQARLPRGVRLQGSGRGLPGWKGLAALAFAFVLVLFAIYQFGIPLVADYAAERVPREWEQEYGKTVIRDMVPEAARVTDPVITGPVRTIYAQLAPSTGLDPAPEHILVWREKMPNAFAAPGGTIVVTTGLLAILETPDQLAAVIAHEIGHVQHRHVMRNAFRQMSLGVLLTLVAGDQSTLSTALQAAGRLGGLSYSRGHEREADDAGLRLMASHGVGKEALVGALTQLKAASGSGNLPGFLSTHPAPKERIERIQRSPVEVSGAAAQWANDDAWRSLKQAVTTR